MLEVGDRPLRLLRAVRANPRPARRRWTDMRDLPDVAPQSFRERWRSRP